MSALLTAAAHREAINAQRFLEFEMVLHASRGQDNFQVTLGIESNMALDLLTQYIETSPYIKSYKKFALWTSRREFCCCWIKRTMTFEIWLKPLVSSTV